jgi:hypothetical protein
MIKSRVHADIPTSKLLEFSRDLDLPSEAFDMVLHDGKLKVRPVRSESANRLRS